MKSASFRAAATAMLVAGALAATTLSQASATGADASADPQPKTAAAITAALNQNVSIPGTAWMTRPDGTIVVSYDSTVVGAKYQALTLTTKQFGKQIVMEKLPGKLQKRDGGQGIYGRNSVCSLGFNVVRSGKLSFLTAGHCGNNERAWYSNESLGNQLGATRSSFFPKNDFALVDYRAGQRPGGSVYLYNGRHQNISRAATPGLGQTVYRSGITSGLHSGKVTGLRATVNYPEGRVEGMIRTSVCSEPGDSGGPLFYRDIAYGLTSGGNGDCRTGGVTYFQPVVEALQIYKVAVY